ncbi:MAG TPA: hypothetical protein VED18_01290 [Candidatus Sulfotelmatobacter sp.]|nr:hypothetical protein [Candidatus Sulfotelmatobacter sp.]
MKTRARLAVVVALAAMGLSACMTYPVTGPSSPAYIGDTRTQADFAQADAACRDLAMQRTGISPGDAAAQSTAGSAVLGTLLGAGLGAGIGAAAGNPAIGAAIGAGAGALLGAGQGSAAGASSAWVVQQRYDAEYHQCMFAAGHKVPAALAPPASQMAAPPPPPPPPGYGSQPPPPGPQAAGMPAGDPTRGQLQNATPWRVLLFIDQDPNNPSGAQPITLNPNEVKPQNLDIGPHRIMAQASVETQFGPRPVGRLDRTIQVDPRGAGWSLRLGEHDFN